MATSNFTIQFAFNGATQAEADQRRDDALRDFALARNLAIFVLDAQGRRTAVIDASKVAPEVRASIFAQTKAEVRAYRQAQAAQVAASTAGSTADAELG